MKRFLFLLIGASFSLVGANVEYNATLSDQEPMIDRLNGILILDHWNQTRKEPVADVNGVVIDGALILRMNPDFLRDLQEQFIGIPLTQAVISSIKRQIAHYYLSTNQPLVVVSIPKQELNKGILQIVVQEAKLGKVTVRGNKYFPTRWFSEIMRSSPGDSIDAQTIFEDVAWLNLNPFRRTDAILKPGLLPGVADIELVTIDRWPYRFYMGGDNMGTVATDRNRLFFGFNFGKSVLKDGQISYQFTSAPNWNLFYSHTASARLPLPWRHIWMLWGGYSQVKPKYAEKNRGISWQVDTRYRIPFFTTPALMQTLVVGYDFKETNNNLLNDDIYVFKQNADINQLMLGYELGFRNQDTRFSLTAELYGNPGGITYANQTKFYEKLRFDAKNQYLYFKMAYSFAQRTKFGWFTYDINGQASTTNLLTSEQFNMTGYNSVRGFEERILSLDNALIFNICYETPHWSPAKTFGWCKQWDELYLIGFFDGGLGGNHRPAPGEAAFKSLCSAGPGIRYQIDRFFTARFDYGFQIKSRGFINPSNSQYNFGMMLSY